MFDQSAEWAPIVGAPVEDDCFDPAWLDDVSRFDHVPELEETGQPPVSQPPVSQPPVSECTPSGWLALELDHDYRPNFHPPPGDDPPPF